MVENGLKVEEYFLRPGFIFLSRTPIIISSVLGSAVAVAFWDEKSCFGGLAHYLYPLAVRKQEATAQYGDAAILHLSRMFREEGSAKSDIKAQIFGGAANSESECKRVADGNIATARRILGRLAIKIISEDVGGDMGRKLVYNSNSNEAIVYKVKKLRGGDWYPYSNEGRAR
ncbi:MAG: chemotaxis protein CheD [Syntrophaceae bacterium]